MTDLRDAGEVSTGDLVDGRYRLEARIGEGATATVHRAEDTLLGRTVAVKILRMPVDDLTSVERARSETALLASLNHHALVTLFDARVSEDDGSYLVMEHVDGPTLRDRIAGGPIGLAEAASLTIDIAEALYVAHTAGIVHRDIKPSNVLLWRSPVPGREWRAKVADFGIAHLLDSSRVTSPGIMVGTAAYVAPEQARGAAPAPPADIYALGLVMIEAVTGTRPFAGSEGIGTVMARLEGPPDVSGAMPEDWQQLLRWMTRTSPEDRPTALEVVSAASRLVPASETNSVDEPTAAVERFTEVALATAILPLEVAEPEPVATAELSSEATPVKQGRRVVAFIVVAALLVATALGGVLWSASLLGAPEPVPTEPVEQQVVEPTVEPEPAVEQPAPVGDTVDVGDSGPASDNSGKGDNGNGNGNGNGKGNSGKGNGNGNR